MKSLVRLTIIIICLNCTAVDANGQSSYTRPGKKDSVVIPFTFKQSALYQRHTMDVIDSIIRILLKNDSVTLTIEGYAHQDEGNDTITKYLSLNRALFI